MDNKNSFRIHYRMKSKCQDNGITDDYTYYVLFIESYGLMKDGNSERALIQYYDNMAKSNYDFKPGTGTVIGFTVKC